jgi:hypothetical protein
MIRPLFDWPATVSRPRRFPNRSERAPRSLLHQAQRLQEMPSVESRIRIENKRDMREVGRHLFQNPTHFPPIGLFR